MPILTTLVEVITAILLPPLAAFFVVGLSAQFWINLLLTLLGWIPGVVHALFLTFSSKGL